MPIDYDEYPDGWKQISWYIRKVRACNRCETCGAKNGEPHPITGSKVVLTVAHIYHEKDRIDFNPFYYDPDDEENELVAECQRDHLWRDRHIHARNRKYGCNHNRKEQLDLWNNQSKNQKS